MSFEFTLLDALQALRCPVLDALAVFFDQAGAHGEIWIAFTAVLLAFRRTRRAGLAMALALGLSDEVQSAAGGIRLDTLFLDEGFGSLDEESLEQAIRVLAGLTEGDRLVGIISHVGALKDRIDRQVVVHKNRTGGSTVELVV